MTTLHIPGRLVRTTQRPLTVVSRRVLCTLLIMTLHFIQTSAPDNEREVQRYGTYSSTETGRLTNVLLYLFRTDPEYLCVS